MIDYSDFAFPKPEDIEDPCPAVRVYPDGREVCNLLTAMGRQEYMRRIEVMWVRQARRCCLCYQPILRLKEATFEHEKGRGMGGGHRDDRIEVDGKWVNGAAHSWCNSEKGSRRGDYNSRRKWRNCAFLCGWVRPAGIATGQVLLGFLPRQGEPRAAIRAGEEKAGFRVGRTPVFLWGAGSVP